MCIIVLCDLLLETILNNNYLPCQMEGATLDMKEQSGWGPVGPMLDAEQAPS